MTSFLENAISEESELMKGVSFKYMVRSLENPSLWIQFNKYRAEKVGYYEADRFDSYEEVIARLKLQATYEHGICSAEIVKVTILTDEDRMQK